MLIAVAIIASLIGWAGLCLAMQRHHRQVLNRDPSATAQIGLRLGGGFCLGGSLAASVAAAGWSFGPVAWVGILSITALSWVFLLPYATRRTLVRSRSD